MIGPSHRRWGFAGKKKVYTVEQMNDFLDVTKGNVRKPPVEFLPDLLLFLASGSAAMRKASLQDTQIQTY